MDNPTPWSPDSDDNEEVSEDRIVAMDTMVRAMMLFDPIGVLVMLTNAAIANDMAAQDLPSATQRAYEMADEGYVCNCGKCADSDSHHKARTINIWRVDFDEDREFGVYHDTGNAIQNHFHGYVMTWRETKGDKGLSFLSLGGPVKRVAELNRGENEDEREMRWM